MLDELFTSDDSCQIETPSSALPTSPSPTIPNLRAKHNRFEQGKQPAISLWKSMTSIVAVAPEQPDAIPRQISGISIGAPHILAQEILDVSSAYDVLRPAFVLSVQLRNSSLGQITA